MTPPPPTHTHTKKKLASRFWDNPFYLKIGSRNVIGVKYQNCPQTLDVY
jgi:hypothetical protein